MNDDAFVRALKKRKTAFLFRRLVLVFALCLPLPAVVWAASGTCKWCGSSNYGNGCPYGPNRIHEHLADDRECVFCGSSNYGSGCPYAPNRRHIHGHGADKCVYCGSRNFGNGCPYSPGRIHER